MNGSSDREEMSPYDVTDTPSLRRCCCNEETTPPHAQHTIGVSLADDKSTQDVLYGCERRLRFREVKVEKIM